MVQEIYQFHGLFVVRFMDRKEGPVSVGEEFAVDVGVLQLNAAHEGWQGQCCRVAALRPWQQQQMLCVLA